MLPLTVLPIDIQNDWGANLDPAPPGPFGAYRLVAARRTQAEGYQGQRIIVSVIDGNERPMADVSVAFSYSTAKAYTLTDDFKWSPPMPHRAHVVQTGGAGEIDEIQGSAVKEGQAGGVTVYVFDPAYASDVVSGAGMLADHTGLHLTFQFVRPGAISIGERIDSMEARLTKLESREKKPPGGTGKAL